MPVDQLERRRGEPGRGDRVHSIAGVAERGEVADDRPRGRRQRPQPERDLGDDAERALGADDQPGEVVAGDALGRLSAQPYQLAGAGDQFQAEHVIARHAVLDAADPAGVRGDVAADRRPRRAGRIRRVPEAVRGDRRPQVVVDDAGLDDGEPLGRVDAQDLVHPVEREHDTAVDGIRAARQPGARPAGDNRHAVTEACPYDGDNLGGRLGPDHRRRLPGGRTGRLVAAQTGGHRGVGQDARRRDRGGDIVEDRSCHITDRSTTRTAMPTISTDDGVRLVYDDEGGENGGPPRG